MREDKLRRIRIKPSLIKEIGSDLDFVIAVQLGRIVNSLRSNLRSQLNVCCNNPLVQTKDRFDLLMIQGGMLYEAIKCFPINYKRLSKLVAWENQKPYLKELGREKSNKESFYNTVLKAIRNKMFFHFDSDIISQALQNYQCKKCTSFGVGRSVRIGDFVYVFCDDILLKYLLDKFNNEAVAYNKYVNIREKIIRISDMLCYIYDNCIKELLNDKVDFVICNKSFGSECDIDKNCQ